MNLYNRNYLDPTQSLYTNECFAMNFNFLIRQIYYHKECLIRQIPCIEEPARSDTCSDRDNPGLSRSHCPQIRF